MRNRASRRGWSSSGALILERPVAIERLPKFNDGWVSVQDAGAQLAATLLDVKDGMRVLDACAAPGGKTTHLLELADIDLVAVDKEEERLQRVRENLQRLRPEGAASFAAMRQRRKTGGTGNCSSAYWPTYLAQPRAWFAAIRTSNGCAGRVTSKALRRSRYQILESLWSLLARDGKLLYATCSIFARENQQVIAAFLAQHDEAVRIELSAPGMTDGQLIPNEDHDGFFYALLHKQA